MSLSYTFSDLPLTADTVGFPSYPPGTVEMTAGSGPDGGIVGTWSHDASATAVDAGGGFLCYGVFPDTVMTRPVVILTDPRPHYLVFNDPQAADGSSNVPPPTTRAYGVSNGAGAGQIVGTYTDASRALHGFIYDLGNTTGTPFTTLDDPLGIGTTQAFGINDADQAVGTYSDNAGAHGFLYSNGTYTTLDDPLGSGGTVAHGINNPGQIVGHYLDGNGTAHGFLFSNGSYTTLDDPLASGGTYAEGISDTGSVVGYYLDAQGSAHGFVESHGSYTTLDHPGAQGTHAESITDTGVIVGDYTSNSGAGGALQSHAFIAQQAADGPAVFDPSWNVLAAADFNGDGLADVAWSQPSSNTAEIQLIGPKPALSTGASATGGGNLGTLGGGVILNSPFDANWSAVAAGDFNGDGRADLVWHRASDSLTEIQFLNGNVSAGGGEILNNSFGNGWDVAGAGDFNGDGKADLVWHRASDGLTEIQLLNGNAAIGGGIILNSPFDKNWNVAAIGDFNGDGKADLVWQRPSDGLVEIQLIEAASGPGGFVRNAGGGEIDGNPFGADWRVAGAGDANGDGTADLFWQRPSDGLTEVQFLNGNAAAGGGLIGVGAGLGGHPVFFGSSVAGVGDFNGDGSADLLFRNAATGTTGVEYLHGTTLAGSDTFTT